MTDVDPRVSFPSAGVIRVHNRSLFGDAEGSACRQFLERVFRAGEVRSVAIRGGRSPHADIRHAPDPLGSLPVLERIIGLLRDSSQPASPRDGRLPDLVNGSAAIAAVRTARDHRGVVRYFRHGPLVTGWETRSDRPGRLRLRNRVLYRKSALCSLVERGLMGMLGVERCRVSSIRATIRVEFDPGQMDDLQVIEILDAVLASADHPDRLDPVNLHLSLCTANLPIAAAAQIVAPPLLPAAMALLGYTAFRAARRAGWELFRQGRPGAGTLDAVVLLGCIGTMAVLPGAVLCWLSSLGRTIVNRTEEQSRRMLLGSFGKQPRTGWLWRDGTEVQVAVERLRTGDLIIVAAGEAVPADGHIVQGRALIDEHSLTGKSMPAERGVGDRVYASTFLAAGEVIVSVEAAGRRTATAQIGRTLEELAGYRLATHRQGERMAATAVLPALGLGAVGMATMGPAGALAVINRDLDTGLRMGMPLALISSAAKCAHLGILVKDGRALEAILEVDTVIWDRSAAIDERRLAVLRVVACDGSSADDVLELAAAAAERFHQPEALAIRRAAREAGLLERKARDPWYEVGQGFAAEVDGCRVRVGGRRFVESAGIDPPDQLARAVDQSRREGTRMVFIGVHDRVAGAIELRPDVNGGILRVIEELRSRGIRRMELVSGDGEMATSSNSLAGWASTGASPR